MHRPESAAEGQPSSRARRDRFDVSTEARVSFQLHREALERYVPAASRVLEVGASGGRFSEILHHLGCKISVADPSQPGLDVSREFARARGFESSLEALQTDDICALASSGDGAYDVVVAYASSSSCAGALSYALERRDRALAECKRVLRAGGVLLLSVPSLWGTIHRHLPAVLAQDLVQARAIIRSGNLPAAAMGLGAERHCHLFRAAELEGFLRRGGLELLSLSASSALSASLTLPTPEEPGAWSALLEFERAACSERGYLDNGTHLIAVCRR